MRAALVAITAILALLFGCSSTGGGGAGARSDASTQATPGGEGAPGAGDGARVAEASDPDAPTEGARRAGEPADVAKTEQPNAPPQERPASAEGPQDKSGEQPESEEPGNLELEGAVEEAEKAYKVTGFLSVSYRLRAEGSQHDEDLYGYISLDGGDPTVDDVTFHAFGRLTFDLDGDEDDPGPFFSLNDGFGDRYDVKLYEAFVDLRRSLAPDSLGIEKIRLGRQSLYVGYTYLVDGARIEFKPIKSFGRMRIAVFGGVPEYLYESSRSGDWLVGTHIRFRPGDDTRVWLRYVRVQDRNNWSSALDRHDDFASVNVRHAIGDSIHVSAEWNTIDAATRDARVAFSYMDDDGDFSLNVDYRWQNDITREFTTPYDPYVVVLGDSFEYHQINVQASKMFDDHFALDGGLTARVLGDSDDDAPFNRDYIRGWLTASSTKWPTEHLDLALTGEYWYADEDEFISVGAEITWRPEEGLKLSLGHYYSLFKYDLFVVDEREDANTFFLRANWKINSSFRLNARYEFETGDEGDFHSALIGLTWSF